jgi:hypothetical protein
MVGRPPEIPICFWGYRLSAESPHGDTTPAIVNLWSWLTLCFTIAADPHIRRLDSHLSLSMTLKNWRAGVNEMAAPFFSLSSPNEERAGERRPYFSSRK